jgi:hypothetical protein
MDAEIVLKKDFGFGVEEDWLALDLMVNQVYSDRLLWAICRFAINLTLPLRGSHAPLTTSLDLTGFSELLCPV